VALLGSGEGGGPSPRSLPVVAEIMVERGEIRAGRAVGALPAGAARAWLPVGSPCARRAGERHHCRVGWNAGPWQRHWTSPSELASARAHLLAADHGGFVTDGVEGKACSWGLARAPSWRASSLAAGRIRAGMP